MENLQKYYAELFGTFVLTFIGTGAVVIAGKSFGVLGIAFAFGITLLAMVYAIGPISGCHINPAVTVGMLTAGRIGSRDAVAYIIVQCIGAIIASVLLLTILTGNPAYSLAVDGLGQNGYGSASLGGYPLIPCLITEIVLTFIFVSVILRATSPSAPAGFAGIAIGFTLFVCHLFGIMVSGSSVNPARSLGPALIVGGTALAQVWLYFVGPVIGALIAACVYKCLLSTPPAQA